MPGHSIISRTGQPKRQPVYDDGVTVPWDPSMTTSAAVLHRWRMDQGITLNSGTVSGVNDIVGAMHQTQGVTLNAPVLSAFNTNYNGQPTITFTSATSQMMAGAVVTAVVAPVSMLIVGQLNLGTRSFISNANGNMVWRSTNTTQYYTTGPGGVDGNASGLIGSPGGILITDDGTGGVAATKIYNNDFSVTSGTGTTRWVSATRMNFGQGIQGVSSCVGEIAEIIIWNNVLDASDRTQLDAYVLSRYGV